MSPRDSGQRPFSTSTPRSSQETAQAEANADRHARRATVLAMVCAGTMIAHQVGGKAARDAGFLSVFDVTLLPWMVIASAVLSLVAVVFFSRILSTWGPSRVVPVAFFVSAVAQGGEYFVAVNDTRIGVVLFYLHMAIFNVILISAFWSLLNEVFDPRRGKRSFGRVASAGALGGVFGGLLAAWAGGALGSSVLLVLGGLHLVCGLVVFAVRPESGGEPAAPHPAKGQSRGPEWREVLRESSYLRNVAVYVALLTAGATLLDYVFKSEAAGAHTDHAGLTRYFALFYTAVAVLGFLLQAATGKRVVERLGLVRTAGTLPVVAGVSAVIAFILPGLGTASFARGLESSTRVSLFRSGYEGLFTPVAVGAKRSVKTLIDVGADRLGDVLGAGGVALLLFLLDGAGVRGFLLGAVLVYAVAVWLLPRLQRGYVGELESRMHRGSGKQGASDDASAAMLRTMTGLDLSMVLDTSLEAPPVSTGDTPHLSSGKKLSPEETLREQVDRAFHEPAGEDHETREPMLADIAAVRSREPLRIRRVLARQHAPSAEIVPHLIPLLAWNEVAADVMRALRHGAPRITGQILDRLLDPDEDFTVRRRLPRALSLCPTDRAVEGLLRGLHDPRFEVRYQCGLVLSRLHALNESLKVDREAVQTAVLHAVQVGKRVWSGARLIDNLAQEDESMFMDDAVRNRANRSLEHVFNLLSLILPPEPLKAAFRGLHTTDPGLRATALEYLENVLPRRIQEALVPILDIRPVHTQDTRPREEIVASLLQSSASIQINLEELRKAYAEQKKSAAPEEDA